MQDRCASEIEAHAPIDVPTLQPGSTKADMDTEHRRRSAFPSPVQDIFCCRSGNNDDCHDADDYYHYYYCRDDKKEADSFRRHIQTLRAKVFRSKPSSKPILPVWKQPSRGSQFIRSTVRNAAVLGSIFRVPETSDHSQAERLDPSPTLGEPSASDSFGPLLRPSACNPEAVVSSQRYTCHRQPSIHEHRDRQEKELCRQSNSNNGDNSNSFSKSFRDSGRRLLELIHNIDALPFVDDNGDSEAQSPSVSDSDVSRPGNGDSDDDDQRQDSDTTDLERSKQHGRHRPRHHLLKFRSRSTGLSRPSMAIRSLPREQELLETDDKKAESTLPATIHAPANTSEVLPCSTIDAFTRQPGRSFRERKSRYEPDHVRPWSPAGIASDYLHTSRSLDSSLLSSPVSKKMDISVTSQRESPLVLFPTTYSDVPLTDA